MASTPEPATLSSASAMVAAASRTGMMTLTRGAGMALPRGAGGNAHDPKDLSAVSIFSVNSATCSFSNISGG